MQRCAWVKNTDLERDYHDIEWGVPVYDDIKLFEFIILESAEAGLNWSMVLKKRENYRKAFDGFDPNIVARYDDAKIESLMKDAGIIRHHKKIVSAIQNAKVVLSIQDSHGSFSKYIWQFVDNLPIQNHWEKYSDIPTVTDLSKKISKNLKAKGFEFFGPMICYAFMQSMGMVNDHTMECFRYSELI